LKEKKILFLYLCEKFNFNWKSKKIAGVWKKKIFLFFPFRKKQLRLWKQKNSRGLEKKENKKREQKKRTKKEKVRDVRSSTWFRNTKNRDLENP